MPLEDNDFGITLARWGRAGGRLSDAALFGPTTARDVWRLPVDSYFFDPLSYYAQNNHDHGLQYLPQVIYLVILRARAIDAEISCNSAYDPYVFLRDAYRQQRLYHIYDGNPPDRSSSRCRDSTTRISTLTSCWISSISGKTATPGQTMKAASNSTFDPRHMIKRHEKGASGPFFYWRKSC
jgi:ABC-type transporter lipoprotein component MlaA